LPFSSCMEFTRKIDIIYVCCKTILLLH